MVLDGVQKTTSRLARRTLCCRRCMVWKRKKIESWRAGKILLQKGASPEPNAAKFWRTLWSFQKWMKSWNHIFPVTVTPRVKFKPTFFTFVSELVALLATNDVDEWKDSNGCDFCADGGEVSLEHCGQGELVILANARLHKLVKDRMWLPVGPKQLSKLHDSIHGL